MRKRTDPDGRPQVIGEYEEGRSVRDDAAMQCHSVGDSAHCVFADAEVHVAAARHFGREGASASHFGVVRLCQICRTADQVRHGGSYLVQTVSRHRTSRDRALVTAAQSC